MADITQLRFAQLLKATLGLKAIDPGRTIAPAVAGTVDMQDPYRPEWRAWRNERTYCSSNVVTNAVGTFAVPIIPNPTGSNRLYVVKRVTWSFLMPTTTAQPGNIWLRIAQVAFGAILGTTPATFKDTRGVGGVPTSSVSQFQGSGAAASLAAAIANAQYFVTVFAAASTAPFLHQVDNLDIIVPPGQQVRFEAAADQATVTAWNWGLTVEGWERSLDPVELNVPPT